MSTDHLVLAELMVADERQRNQEQLYLGPTGTRSGYSPAMHSQMATMTDQPSNAAFFTAWSMPPAAETAMRPRSAEEEALLRRLQGAPESERTRIADWLDGMANLLMTWDRARWVTVPKLVANDSHLSAVDRRGWLRVQAVALGDDREKAAAALRDFATAVRRQTARPSRAN